MTDVDMTWDDMQKDMPPLRPWQSFWLTQGSWPLDTDDMVFLGRAVHLVGQKLFEAAWTGYEPAVDPSLSELPASATDAPSYLSYRLREYRDAAGVKIGMLSAINPQTWERARLGRSALIAKLQPARARLSQVTERITAALQSGTLPYCVRFDENGTFSDPLPASWWNTELTDRRFGFCKLSLSEPISATRDATGFRYIFLPRKSMQTALGLTAGPIHSNRNRREFVAELVAAVRAAPNARGQKAIWEQKARTTYLLTVGVFEEAWSETLDKVPGNTWRQPGAPPRSTPNRPA